MKLISIKGKHLAPKDPVEKTQKEYGYAFDGLISVIKTGEAFK